MVARKPYQVIEPTFEVSGGTPVEALEKVLNDYAAEGYRFAGVVAVREAVDGRILEPVQVMVMELISSDD